ncbi:MAG: glycosyltransferase [Balneolaceae bacterium]|nr:glycosyltransferase [Balneolaceae bacterium]
MSFSVLISIYKHELVSNLNLALNSIWEGQVLKPSQIVLVKDGPLSPELDAEIEKWSIKLGETLKLVVLDVNQGLGKALNFGLVACDYDLVARMDTDDIAHPERFKLQVECLDTYTNLDVLGTSVYEISSSGDLLGTRRMPTDHGEIINSLWACPLIHPTIMMRREKVLMAGNYSPLHRRRQDYELWFRCAQNGLIFGNLETPLLYYRFGIYTHKKQSLRVTWEQGMVGFRGASAIGLPFRFRLACFFPFFRSLLPLKLQHIVYKWLKPFDPRQR